MVQAGLLLSDAPVRLPAAQQFADIRRIVDAAQRNGFTYVAIGQHFLYGDLRWLQPVPLLARLAADVGPDVKLVTQIMIAPLYQPVLLAEEIATLDVVTEGRLVFGIGLGYRAEEFDWLGVPFQERAARMDESIVLMKQLWMSDEVSFHGRFWTLDNVRPHIRPVQCPHPPIWIGGQSDAGARRAARLGNAFACPPETPKDEAAARYELVREGLHARGLPFGPQPLRRNVLVADTTEQAIAEYARVAQSRYIAYAQRGFDGFEKGLEDDFARAVAGHAVVGTPDEVTAHLIDLVTTLPVDPLLMRPQWPTMDADETIGAIDRLGREVVPSLRAVTPLAPGQATQGESPVTR
jgi:alkanesulfonate monooxygenase SsuD/methylene tetrahydromethanopterin reductase-like flavin-dependent oxidoreductase (luciferase family)